MNHFYNDPVIKSRRRNLRKNQTDTERKLWSVLRAKQINGLKFFRQYGVGPYILDFYCPKYRLAIELDGSQHGEPINRQRDEKREEYLKGQDINILRFWNNEVLNNFEGVEERLMDEIKRLS
ncbi:endonuclease domain-containing protein [Candidatus Falkowbacteria bacterium]|nr:endonuclease domain-containing protein [Candidatus Falkowbacteria bacterium]